MAQSSLELKKSDFDAAVAFYLGYGRGADFDETAWTTTQRNIINEHVATGLRRFYFPSLTPNAPSSYSWTFLKPTAEIHLSSGIEAVALPDDFNGFDSAISVTQDGGTYPTTIWPTGIGRINQMYAATPDASGRPAAIAVSPIKGTTTLNGQRFQLTVFPIPDGEYTLTGQYVILPNCLTGTMPYCYGGAAHADTIRESCLAAAEKDSDDMSGIHEMQFQQRLAASISIDRRMQAQVLGYNGDKSVRMNRGAGLYNRGYDWRIPVTVNGVDPG